MMMMNDRGCAFKVVDADGVRYYTSPEVLGLADFARCLHENERDGGGSPLPLAGRIAGAVECPEAEKKFSCFLIADIVGNVLWVNEDHGDGLAHYVFPLGAVLEAAAMEGDVWALLLARFPNARMDIFIPERAGQPEWAGGGI